MDKVQRLRSHSSSGSAGLSSAFPEIKAKETIHFLNVAFIRLFVICFLFPGFLRDTVCALFSDIPGV